MNVEKRLREAFAALPLPETDLADRVIRRADHADNFPAAVRRRRRAVMLACVLVLMLSAISLATHLGFEVVYVKESSRFELSTEAALRNPPEGFAQRFEALADKPVKQEGYFFHTIRFATVEDAVEFWGVPRMENKAMELPMTQYTAFIHSYFHDGKLFGTGLFTRHYLPEKVVNIHMTSSYLTPESYDTKEEGVFRAISDTFYLPFDPDNPETTPVVEIASYTSAVNGLTAIHSFAYATQSKLKTIYNTLSILDDGVLYWLRYDYPPSSGDPEEIARLILDGFVPLDASSSDSE